jgi:hypothetical protein
VANYTRESFYCGMAAEWEDSPGFLDEGVCANLMVCKKLEWAIEWFESEGQKALVEPGASLCLRLTTGWGREPSLLRCSNSNLEETDCRDGISGWGNCIAAV